MSFKQVETYFQQRLKEVEPQFKEHEDAFSIENIGSSRFNHAYHVFFTHMKCSPPSGQVTTDILTVDVALFLKGFRDVKTYLIDSYDIANAFRLNCMRPEYAMNGTLIKNVICTQIKADPEKGNNNAIKMTCTFDVTVNFSTDVL